MGINIYLPLARGISSKGHVCGLVGHRCFARGKHSWRSSNSKDTSGDVIHIYEFVRKLEVKCIEECK